MGTSHLVGCAALASGGHHVNTFARKVNASSCDWEPSRLEMPGNWPNPPPPRLQVMWECARAQRQHIGRVTKSFCKDCMQHVLSNMEVLCDARPIRSVTLFCVT